MGLVSAAIGALAVRSTHELRLGRISLESLQRRAIAQAAIQQAIAVIQRDVPAVDHLNESWATGVDPETQQSLLNEIAVGPGTFSIGVWDIEEFRVGMIDEDRKLNLNVAAPEHLARLIESVKTGDVDSLAVANAIADWRDEPEGPACTGTTPPCHNGRFETVDELRLVPGMTPELFAVLEPYVTVYGSGVVNANTASATLLDAMNYPGESIVQQRHSQVFDDTNSPPAGLGMASSAFTVPVDVALRGTSVRAHLSAVIDRNGCASSSEDARCILAWQPR